MSMTTNNQRLSLDESAAFQVWNTPSVKNGTGNQNVHNNFLNDNSQDFPLSPTTYNSNNPENSLSTRPFMDLTDPKCNEFVRQLVEDKLMALVKEKKSWKKTKLIIHKLLSKLYENSKPPKSN